MKSKSLIIFFMGIGVGLVFAKSIAAPTSQSYQSQVLSAHNHFRALHHAPALVWDNELANYAEKYASECEFKHSATPYGENLATGYPTVDAAVKIWYDESRRYSYGSPGFSSKTGHFTQLVWKGSERLGCGYVACNGRNGTPGKFLVCEYSPAGNVLGRKRFEENVLPT